MFVVWVVDPLVPVTVTTYLPAGVPVPLLPDPLLLPPHPTAAMRNAATSSNAPTRQRLRQPEMPNRNTLANIAPPPPSHSGALRGSNPAAWVLMVRVALAVLLVPVGVTELELRVQVMNAEDGQLTVRLTALLKP